MVIFFINGRFTILRVMATPGKVGAFSPQIIAQNVPARVESSVNDLRLAIGGSALDMDYQISMELGTDVRVGDRLTGYNPRNLVPETELVVQRVNVNDGPFLRHLEVWAQETRDPKVA